MRIDSGVVEPFDFAAVSARQPTSRARVLEVRIQSPSAKSQIRSTLKSGWVDGEAVPVVTDAAPGLVATEAANGFAQPALRASAPLLREKARSQGIAAVAIRNSHHFAALWPDIERFAVKGFIVLAMVNGRKRVVVWDGKRKLLGTSPMGFACPRRGRLPLVWDQASSVIAQGEILLAAQHGDMLPEGVGLDGDGQPTTDPNAVLDGGSCRSAAIRARRSRS